jgi:Tfp pilus assembly protein PilO
MKTVFMLAVGFMIGWVSYDVTIKGEQTALDNYKQKIDTVKELVINLTK